MTIHFLLQLSHSKCRVLSVVGSTKTHLSNWIVLLITLPAVARGPIKVGKRFELTKKHFSCPFTSDFPFVVFSSYLTKLSRVRLQALGNSCKYNIKNGEGCRGPESATMHNVLWSLGYSSRCVRFGDLQTCKSYVGKKKVTVTGIKAPPATRAQITGGNKHIKERGFFGTIYQLERLRQASVLIPTANIILTNTEKYPWKMNRVKKWSLWNSFLVLLKTVITASVCATVFLLCVRGTDSTTRFAFNGLLLRRCEVGEIIRGREESGTFGSKGTIAMETESQRDSVRGRDDVG